MHQLRKNVTMCEISRTKVKRFRASEFVVSSARRVMLLPILWSDEILAQVDSTPVWLACRPRDTVVTEPDARSVTAIGPDTSLRRIKSSEIFFPQKHVSSPGNLTYSFQSSKKLTRDSYLQPTARTLSASFAHAIHDGHVSGDILILYINR